MTDLNYHNLLLNVLASDSPESAASEICELAEATWYRGFLPDVDKVPKNLLRKAAYFADFLASNQVMPVEQSRALKAQLKKVWPELSEASTEAFYLGQEVTKTNRDALAAKWGLTAGLQAKLVPGLLDLQRRSYKSGLAS